MEAKTYHTKEEKKILWDQLKLKVSGLASHEPLGPLNLFAYPHLTEPLTLILLLHWESWLETAFFTKQILKNIIHKGEFADEDKKKWLQKMYESKEIIAIPLQLELCTLTPQTMELCKELKEAGINNIIFAGANKPDGVDIKYIDDVISHGAFAAKDFDKGNVLGFYDGIVYYNEHISENKTGCPAYFLINCNETIDLEKRRHQIFLSIKNAAKGYTSKYLPQHPYFFLQKNGHHEDKMPLCIDAQNERNEMRFVNHSYFPNCIGATSLVVETFQSKEDIFCGSHFAVAYYAEKDIKKGEQLLKNYEYTPDNEKFLGIELADLRSTDGCYHCQSLSASVKCSKCKIARYCNEECENKDAQNHKPFCRIKKMKN